MCQTCRRGGWHEQEVCGEDLAGVFSAADGLPALITSILLCLSLLLLLPHFLCCLEYTWEPGGLAP